MNIQEYQGLSNDKKCQIKKLFFNSKLSECCDFCDSVIDGYCYACKTWVSNFVFKDIECFRVNKLLEIYLEDFDKNDFEDDDEEYDFDEEDEDFDIIPFDEYFDNDYLVEKLLNGQLQDALDEYEKYENSKLEDELDG